MPDRAVVYAATRNLYDDMIVAAKSLLYHDGADRIFFLTEDDSFPQHLPDCITNINVASQTFFSDSGPNYYQHWSYMILLRAAFTKLFPQYDRILSLDCDTIVNNDISGIWQYDISNTYYAGVREIIPGFENEQPHCNFGVIMFNLAKLRTDHMDDTIIHALNTQHFQYPEQNAFSHFCGNNFLTLPPEYNAMWYTSDAVAQSEARIIHYANYPRTGNVLLYRKYARKSWDNVLAKQLERK